MQNLWMELAPASAACCHSAKLRCCPSYRAAAALMWMLFLLHGVQGDAPGVSDTHASAPHLGADLPAEAGRCTRVSGSVKQSDGSTLLPTHMCLPVCLPANPHLPAYIFNNICTACACYPRSLPPAEPSIGSNQTATSAHATAARRSATLASSLFLSSNHCATQRRR